MIAAAFYPKDVIVRLSDFKSNEYANLIGGRRYEPTEENPMLGFRGASRYYDPRYQAGFALECRALRQVRDEMGLNNVKIMIPFCRTLEEGRRVLDEMTRHGLRRGERGLEVYLMCEIPSNVILAEDFAALCDGFSIGSNDLTQLTEWIGIPTSSRRSSMNAIPPSCSSSPWRFGQPNPQAGKSAFAGKRPATIRSSRSFWWSKASTASRSIPTRS
jgi:phosphoenolpyruvate synthase/pyruvate phosphate dikinase